MEYPVNSMVGSSSEQERVELMRKRFVDPEEKKQFRYAFCFKAGYDFSSLKPYCEEIKMVTDGMGDHFDKIRARIELGLMEYDSDKDLIVPAGRAVDNLFVGQTIAPKILQKPRVNQSYAIAVYTDYRYIFFMIPLDAALESYQIRTT